MPLLACPAVGMLFVVGVYSLGRHGEHKQSDSFEETGEIRLAEYAPVVKAHAVRPQELLQPPFGSVDC